MVPDVNPAEIKCAICGATCFGCECAPCPKCIGILCATCTIPAPIWEQTSVYGVACALGVKRDAPIPEHSGPKRISTREVSSGQIAVVQEDATFLRRELGSEPLISDDARIVAGALARIFGFACAGVVAGAAVVMLAAAAVFSGELPD